MAIEDKEIWSAYAKGVKQLVHISKAAKAAKTARKTKDVETGPADKPVQGFRMASTSMRAQTGSMKKGKPFQQLLDRRTERQLKEGAFKIEARLDLHGKTQNEAYGALERFIDQQIRGEKRNLLIITGKGAGGKGALRTNLIHWLETFPSSAQILGVRPASPKHGGDGAFYLVLRRRKDPHGV